MFDRASDSYRVTGGGADMWGTADAFHFSWTELAGDATLTADGRFADGANIPLEKAVLIFRQNLEPSAAYADVAVHADGHTTMQYRVNSDEKTADVTALGRGATRLRIERRGNRFTAFASSADEKLNEISSITIAMRNPVYVGIGVCAHNSEGLATVTFSNVQLDQNGVPIHGRPRKEKLR